jgi:hypothetical protein
LPKTGGARRRRLRRVSLAAAGACAILFVALPAKAQDATPAGSDEAPASALSVWHGSASAQAISFNIDQSVLPVTGIFNPILAEGDSTYETDNQTAQASLLYPGNGLIQGPNLLCGTFGGMFPAQFAPILDACTKFNYPLTVKADNSDHDAATVGRLQLGKAVDPISADAIGASAHADKDASTTVAQVADLKVLGLPGINLVPLLPIDQLKIDPAVARVGQAKSTTDQRIKDDKLVVTADSVISGVDLVGGLIHLGAIHSTSTITDDGHGKRTSSAKLEVGGVTVGGLPAEITTDGIIVGPSSTPLGPLATQTARSLNQLLSALGVRIALLPATHTTDDGNGQAVASAAGLLLEITLNASGLPAIPGPLGDMDLNGSYIGTLQLGYTGASGAASAFGEETTPGGGDESLIPPDLGDQGGFDLGGTGGLDLGQAPNPSPTPPAVTPPSGNHLVRSLSDGFDDRLGLLYLAFAFMVLALCLVPRLTLPARLPGSSP